MYVITIPIVNGRVWHEFKRKGYHVSVKCGVLPYPIFKYSID